jgi:AcrR family transcriptional regulator
MRKRHNAEIRKPEILENYYQVIIEEGIEGASIGKIAARMQIHPSLIIHYFKNKKNMTNELSKLLVEKYEAPEFLHFDKIEPSEERLDALLDTIFSFEWSRTVDAGVHFGFYYLSFRHDEIKKRFKQMFIRFRDYLAHEFEILKDAGVINTSNTKKAADLVLTMMEGLEFHAHFVTEGEPFDIYADVSKKTARNMLKSGTV